MLNQLSSIVWDLFIFIFLSIGKPSKEWIVVSPINKTTFLMYVVMRNLSSLFVFKNIMFCSVLKPSSVDAQKKRVSFPSPGRSIALMICVLHVPATPLMYYSS
jgi:hypothetical protein